MPLSDKLLFALISVPVALFAGTVLFAVAAGFLALGVTFLRWGGLV